MALPLQDPVPISCRIYLSPTMPLGRYHSQCKKELGALKTRGANWRKRRSLCCCGGTQMDGSLVDTQAGFKPFYITQVWENAYAECQIRSCCCLIRFGLCVRHYMCLKFWFKFSFLPLFLINWNFVVFHFSHGLGSQVVFARISTIKSSTICTTLLTWHMLSLVISKVTPGKA